MFLKGTYLQKGDKSSKKTWVIYFSLSNPYRKVRDPSMHSSKVTGCLKKEWRTKAKQKYMFVSCFIMKKKIALVGRI